jgi:hypothetical protein
MLNILGAKYIVEDPGRDLYPEADSPNKMPNSFKLKKALTGEVNVFANPDALPRSFFTTRFEVVSDKRAALARMADPSFDYKQVVILEEQPLEQSAGESAGKQRADVIVEQQGEDAVALIVDAPSAGLVFLGDTYLPGWRVKVDGRETKPYRADYLFMAFPVAEGKHVIDVEYAPVGYRLGKWITLLSLGFFALLLAFDVARRRAKNLAPWEAEKKSPAPEAKKQPAPKQAAPAARGPVRKPNRG